MTKTKQGISIREFMLGLLSGQVYGLNKRYLDVRRPNRKPTSEDQEEGLIQYRSVLDYNPKLAVTRADFVPKVKEIVSSVTMLESTSLVIMYGLDIYCTLRKPSQSFDMLSEDFNYSSLLGTIAVLGLATLVADYFAKRKALYQEWK